MASKIKTNKKHGGKEFRSFFHFIGKVHKHVKGYGDQAEEMPFYYEAPTKTGKPRRVLQFDIETAKFNKLKIEQNGMEMPAAYAYSSQHKQSVKLDWDDRNNKDSLPDDTYHLMETDWDKTERLVDGLKEGMWVEIKGEYEFDSFKNDEGREFLITKRMVNSIEPVENGQEIKIGKTVLINNYVTDFKSDDFKELNYVSLQVGIRSVYQDEETKETKINGTFLAYGKERSIPKDVELKVKYNEPEAGKVALADAFTNLNRLDFVEITGTDNNRPEFSEVEEQSEIDEMDDPFAEVDESETTVKTNKAISGNIRGIYVSSVVKGSLKKSLLTEEELKKDELIIESNDNPFSDTDSEDENPFSDNPFDTENPFE